MTAAIRSDEPTATERLLRCVAKASNASHISGLNRLRKCLLGRATVRMSSAVSPLCDEFVGCLAEQGCGKCEPIGVRRVSLRETAAGTRWCNRRARLAMVGEETPRCCDPSETACRNTPLPAFSRVLGGKWKSVGGQCNGAPRLCRGRRM